MDNKKYNKLICRINLLNKFLNPKWGKMNVSQMVCHCTDQLRLLFGEIPGIQMEEVDIKEIQLMARLGKTIKTVNGLDQIMGEGTKPELFENDIITLKNYISRFVETDDDYTFHFHPYYGELDKERWDRLVVYHLDHHLKQFGY